MRSRLFAMAVLFFILLSSQSAGQVPHTLSYQGVLTDSLGHPKSDGSYSFEFRLYSSSTGGSALWTETKTLHVSQGLFSTTLGDQVPINLPFDAPYWLSVQVSPDPELSPRVPLTSAAYSLHSLNSDTALYARNASVPPSADSARIAGTVPNNSLTAATIRSGQVIKSLNNLKDDVTLAAGSNVTITPNGNTLTIATSAAGLSLPFSSTTSSGNSLLSLKNSGGGSAISGTSLHAFGVYGQGDSAIGGVGEHVGLFGKTNSTSFPDAGVSGLAPSSSGGAVGVYGDASASTGAGIGVYGTGGQIGGSFIGGTYGVDGTSNLGVGVHGSSNFRSGVEGVTSVGATYASGVLGEATSGTGPVVGVRGVAVNSVSGEGVRGEGYLFGVYGFTQKPNAIGVFGESDGSQGIGVEGFASSDNGIGVECGGKFYQLGGVFEAHPTSTTWSTNKPATVKLNDGAKVKLFSEEATEVFFNDYGEATLQNGRVHVDLDPKFLQTVTIDASHPMRVFVQLLGDCKGVYVTNRTTSGFDVVELQGGTSNAQLSYRIVCKRKFYEDERLATEQQDTQYNTHMLETVWPEVMAEQKAQAARASRNGSNVPETVPSPKPSGARR